MIKNYCPLAWWAPTHSQTWRRSKQKEASRQWAQLGNFDALKPGETVSLTFQRGREQIELQVTLEENES